MKLLIIINSLGDSGQYFIPFFESLINRGHHLIVVSTITPSMCSKLSRMGIRYVNLGKIHRGLSSMLGLVRFPLILAKIMSIISNENIDLIHVQSGFVPLSLSCIVSKLKKIPLVLTIHGGQPSFSFMLNPIRQIQGIISTSLERKEAFPEEVKRVKVIPLPINLDRFFPNSSNGETKKLEHRVSLFNSGSPNTIVYSLLESAPRISELFRNTKIIITGWYSHYFELVNAIKKMNKKIGREMIILTGFVEDTPKIMNQADILIGVGVVVAEAMACGKPVIVARSNFGGIVNEQNVAELRKYNFTGRNSNMPTNPENIFKSISTLLSDQKYMKHLGEFGRKYAEKEFEPNKIGIQVELVYKYAQKNFKDSANFTSFFSAGWHILTSMLYVFIKELITILNLAHKLEYLRKPLARKTSRALNLIFNRIRT